MAEIIPFPERKVDYAAKVEAMLRLAEGFVPEIIHLPVPEMPCDVEGE